MPRGQGLASDVPQDQTAALDSARFDFTPADFVPADFIGLMARLAPFEPRPHVAVAVSGGGDSMALALLAHDWAQARGGRITALTVDHALRPEAAAEAAQVGAWCQARGIAHVVLTRIGAAPANGIQAFARTARYALLEAWCRDHIVLHLLLAHQSEDQAETVAMRAESGSGADGLAGMASVVERRAVRLLRPLLTVPRARLRDYLVARGQAWIEDPSNRNPAFTRVRIREALAQARPGLSHGAHAVVARRQGTARAAREAAMAQWLARFVMVDPLGFATIDPRGFAYPAAVGVRALGAVLATISGSAYPPRTERIERLYRDLTGSLPQDRTPFQNRTLGGCLVLRRHDKFLICRELSAVVAPLAIVPGQEILWDGRFRVTLDSTAPQGLMLGALGADAPVVAREQQKSAVSPLPAVVRAVLPAVRDAKGVVAVPLLGYFKCYRTDGKMAGCRVEFGPIRSLTGAGFTIV